MNIQQILDDVKGSYLGRPYHNITHINDMMSYIADRNLTIDTEELELAIIFHDIVYDPRNSDNEEASVEFMKNYFTRRDISVDFKTIEKLILATKQHQFGDDYLVNLMISADLNIFNKSLSDLIVYEHQIFKEYQFVDIEIYITERIKFLRKMIVKISSNKEKFNSNSIENIEEMISHIQNQHYKIGIYAGSFNPFHLGHLNVLQKSEKIFDKVIIARGRNPEKSAPTSELPVSLSNQKIEYDTLITDLFKNVKNVEYFLIRGMRNEYDMASEENMRKWIHELNPSVQTVYFFCDAEYEHISSSQLKSLKSFCPDKVEKYIVR